MPKIAPPAPPMIPARWKGGVQVPGLVVLHATVGPTKAGSARGVARFFQTETNPTSAHYVVDEAEDVQCVPDHTVAYHCGYNDDSVAIEMCFMPLLASLANWLLPKAARPKVKQHRNRLVPGTWLRPDVRSMLRRTAALTAQLCLAYGIPVRYLSDAELLAWDRAGRPAAKGGIATHAQMSRVFKRSTHWDPGAWPSARFLKMTQRQVTHLERTTKP